MSQRPWRPARGSAKAPPRDIRYHPRGLGMPDAGYHAAYDQCDQRTRGGRRFGWSTGPDHVEAWRAARLDLLKAEKQLTAWPTTWLTGGESCRGFASARTTASTPKPVRSRSPTSSGWVAAFVVYHLIFDPGWDEACPSCSAIADGFDKTYLHLQNHASPSRQYPERRLRSCSPTGAGSTGVSRGPRHGEVTLTMTSMSRSTLRWRLSSTTTGAKPTSKRLTSAGVGGPGSSTWYERLRVRRDDLVYHTCSTCSRAGPGHPLEYVAVAESSALSGRNEGHDVVPPPRPVRGRLSRPVNHLP